MKLFGYAHVLRSCLLLGLVIGLPLLAGAQVNVGNTFNPVGSGARAMGQGNAFIAVADDATAASWNPAGLAQLESPECSFAVEYWHHYGNINSDTQPGARGIHTLDGTDLNYWSIAYPFVIEGRNVVMSLNYLRLYDFGQAMQFPLDYSGGGIDNHVQYSLQQEGSLSALAPALAVNVTDKLALGCTFNIWNDDLTHSSAFSKRQYNLWDMTIGSLHGETMSDQYEEFTVQHGYSVAAGALYRLDKYWTIGAVVKPPFTLAFRHITVTDSQLTGDFGNVPFNRAETVSNASLDMPLMVGGGVAVRPMDPLTLSLDVTWTQWSTFAMRADGVTYNPLNQLPLQDGHCRDTFAVRAGAEYILPFDHYQLPLRCGLGYDPSPAIGRVDDFFTASIGAGLQWSRYALDLAYELRSGHNVNTTSLLAGIGAEDAIQQRAMLSLIVYL